MSNTSSNFEMTGTLLGQEFRKRKTSQEKIAIIQQTMEPGVTVSHVACLHGIQPSLLFKWKKQYLLLYTSNLGVSDRACGPSSTRTPALVRSDRHKYQQAQRLPDSPCEQSLSLTSPQPLVLLSPPDTPWHELLSHFCSGMPLFRGFSSRHNTFQGSEYLRLSMVCAFFWVYFPLPCFISHHGCLSGLPACFT